MTIFGALKKEAELDQNWIHLMIAARKLGISKSEVRMFLSKGTIDHKENNEK